MSGQTAQPSGSRLQKDGPPHVIPEEDRDKDRERMTTRQVRTATLPVPQVDRPSLEGRSQSGISYPTHQRVPLGWTARSSC